MGDNNGEPTPDKKQKLVSSVLNIHKQSPSPTISKPQTSEPIRKPLINFSEQFRGLLQKRKKPNQDNDASEKPSTRMKKK